MSKKEIKTKKLFLTDRALQNADNDEFGHNDYSLLLEKLIREQPTPFNIGIFGKWGVGKSSIINLLKEKLKSEKKKFKFIDINVWKYNEMSLQRKFIFKIAEGLNLSRDLEEINKEIYADREYETALLNIDEILKTVFNTRSYALWSLLISLVLLLVVRIINILDVDNELINNIFQTTEDIILLPLVGSLLYWIFEIIKKARLKLKIGKYDSQEQFEKKFIELIKKDKCKKIIFIDDLDRCSKEKVVKTLETIKTFLDVESCIFIIACDDDIIKKAVNKTNELYNEYGINEGADYLEKFFQYTLRIPPFSVIDMKKYMHNLLEKSNSDLIKLGSTLDDIIFIIINRNIKSPRNAITAINEFSTSFVLAKTREKAQKSKLPDKKITNNLPILALVISIKLHFPEFYRDMLNQSNLIFWIKDIIEKNIDNVEEHHLKICSKYFMQVDDVPQNQENTDQENENNSWLKTMDWNQPKNEYRNLLDFIESVKEFLVVDDIMPFLYLGIDETSYMIGDKHLKEFDESLRNGIESKVSQILDEADESKKEHLFDHIIDLIEHSLERVELRKSLQILSSQIHKCPTNKLRRASRVFKNKFYKRQMSYEEFTKYHPKGIFVCAQNLSHNRNEILKLAVNFIQNDNTEFNKSLLHEIFENEPLIETKSLREKVASNIDNLMIHEPEKQEEKILDINYVKGQIKKYEDQPSVIKKFFSGDIIDRIVDELIDVDANADTGDEDYLEIVSIFEIIKKHVLDSDINRLSNYYKTLIQTRLYYQKTFEDIEKRKSDIPTHELYFVSIPMLEFVEDYGDAIYLEKVFNVIKYWIDKNHEIVDDGLIKEIKNKIVKLSKDENEDFFDQSISIFIMFLKLFPEEEWNDLVKNYIDLIQPLNNLDRANKIKELILKIKEELNAANRIYFVDKLAQSLNSVEGLKDENNYMLWYNLFNDLSKYFEVGELDKLLKPNNAQFILNPGFPEGTNLLREKYCNFIIIDFDKFTDNKQNEYFELFRAFLSSNNVNNSEYSIKNIFPVRKHLVDSTFTSNSAPLFIQQFKLEISPSSKLKNGKILIEMHNYLNEQQINKALGEFVIVAHYEPSDSSQFLIDFWAKIPDDFKFKILKKLIPFNLLGDKNFYEHLFTKIKTDVENLQSDYEKLNSYLNQREEDLKETEQQRDFYAQIINNIKEHFSENFRINLKSNRIAEIKSESDIDFCRNKMSTLIGIKDNDYDKDNEINDLFFNMLNDTIEKKKLAIDVFEFYYEDKHPYHRKGALVEYLENLREELDKEYQKKLKHLAKKYDLKVKKSFWNSVFGN
jgi:hypothetical protein